VSRRKAGTTQRKKNLKRSGARSLVSARGSSSKRAAGAGRGAIYGIGGEKKTVGRARDSGRGERRDPRII
jgi:hypothetical protein